MVALAGIVVVLAGAGWYLPSVIKSETSSVISSKNFPSVQPKLPLQKSTTKDAVKPSVSVTAPSGGSTLSKTVTVSASASDNVGVVGVQFKLDGSNIGARDITPPYAISWDTLKTSNGSHILTALTRDRAGNQTISAGVTVKINNAVSSAKIPLMDMGNQRYLGFSGGLYENGKNIPPADHNSAGLAKVSNVVPRDTAGNPSSTGKIVLMSMGMSNTTQEWCATLRYNQTGYAGTSCESWSFIGQARASARVNNTSLVIVNGALGSQDAKTWNKAAGSNYDRVRDNVLSPQGLTEAQVQIIWLKVADISPSAVLPSASADAYILETYIGNILRAAKTRYPNLQQVFLSSRIYGGYATIKLNPEPHAYESGFAVKWTIQAQIDQMRNGGTVVDKRAGNLNYTNGTVPWIAWGPYLWANGTTQRSDGLKWVKSDFESDGTHPSTSGETKVGKMLLNFFLNSTYTPWFRAGN